MATTAAMFLGSKYGVSRDPDGEGERVLRPAFDELRKALGARPAVPARRLHVRRHRDGGVAADAPGAEARADRSGDARDLENDELANRFEDLLEWRDMIYAKHRPGG